MSARELPANPYVLLTPGPLSTTASVKEVMLRDWCTWDADYNEIVQDVRRRLVELSTRRFREDYTSVLMQGSGTFSVEATLGTVIPPTGKVLVLANGAYGERMGQIAQRLRIENVILRSDETAWPDPSLLKEILSADAGITHVALVHCETTTGILNPLEEIAAAVRAKGRSFIVDAMSSFGGIPMDIGELGADFLVSSSNKCIQGVPGFGFVVARRKALEACEGRARSLSLDLYDQWRTMEDHKGKWRFTSPTHVVRAFTQALVELEEEGGVEARSARYRANHFVLVRGMNQLGFECLLPAELQSPIITSFLEPAEPGYSFSRFYADLKAGGFVIYPGKVSRASTFRIGTIGDVTPATISSLIETVKSCISWTAAGK